MSSALFEPISLRGLTLPNRIVVSPMCMYAAVDGNASDWHLMHWGQYAIGACGLLLIEATGVEPRGRITPNCLGLYSDANEAAIRKRLDFCRAQGDIPIGIQLAHSGRKGSTRVPWEGRVLIAPDAPDGWLPIGPSALPILADEPPPMALERAGMEDIRDFFVAAARRADRLGLDLIEIHAAHGYLLSSFLSPLANQRDDAYGGSLENRMRYPLEIFTAMRKAWPENKPLGVRFSATDWVDGGWDEADSVLFAAALRDRGCDYVVLSSGGNGPGTFNVVSGRGIPLGPGYQVPFADLVRRETGMPTMAVGMITEPRQAEDILTSGKADMVALGRQLLYEPHWAWRAADELGVKLDYPMRYERAAPARRAQAFPNRVAAK